MLGPLLNPAGAVYGLIGVYSPDISMLMAQALQQLGTRKALVVHSQVTSIPQWCFDLSSHVSSHVLHTLHLLVDAWPCMLCCTVIKQHRMLQGLSARLHGCVLLHVHVTMIIVYRRFQLIVLARYLLSVPKP